ncbi:hypothetical protein HRG_012312 [Hirsutella rhossiliensis]
MSLASDLDGSSKGAVLNGPCDWKQWISIIKKFASSVTKNQATCCSGGRPGRSRDSWTLMLEIFASEQTLASWDFLHSGSPVLPGPLLGRHFGEARRDSNTDSVDYREVPGGVTPPPGLITVVCSIEHQICFATSSHNVWEYLDPSIKEGKPVLQQPVEPTFSQINPEASELVDLTLKEFRLLEFLHTQYRSKLQGHRDQVKALASLQQHIVKTIGNYYSTIAEEHDVAKQLSLLQARVAPTDWALEREVLQRYRSTLQSPERTKVEAWITQWQKVLTEAKQLGLPDVQGLRPTQDFLQAVSLINAPFTDYWVNKMGDDAACGKPTWKNEFPDGIKISEIFERAHRIKAANNQKGSFGASFQGKEASDSKSKHDNNQREENGWKSSRNSAGVPLCVCGKYHRFSECFYLIELIRPDGWKANEKVEKKIRDVQDSTPWVRKVIADTQKRMQKETEDSSLKGAAFASFHTKSSPHNPPSPPPTTTTSFSVGKPIYQLRDSFILDFGSDTHICNDQSRFLEYTALAEPEELFAGDSQLQILGYGMVRMRLEDGLFQLNDVAFVPNFHTNIASLDRFLAKGYDAFCIWMR